MTSTRGLIIGLVFFCLFAGLIGLFGANMASTYNVSYDNSTMESLNKLQDIDSDVVAPMRNQIYSNLTSVDSGATDSGYFSNGVFAALKLVKNIPSVAVSMVSDVSEILGLPPIVMTAIILILFIIIAYAMIDALFGGRN